MGKRLAIYLIVTFGLTWGLLIPAGVVLGTFENGEASSTLMLALIAVSMFFPLAGALIANCACKPGERIVLDAKPLIGRNVKYYLVAWFAPAGFALGGCLIFFMLNPQWFDPTMQSYIAMVSEAAGMSVEDLMADQPPAQVMIAAALFSALTYAPFINMIPAFGEELGWRGMLLPTLEQGMSMRSAALLSGVIWGLWHAPVIAMGHNYGMGYAGFPITGIFAMVLMCCALSCWLALLRQRTQSIWPCALAHGSFNAITNMGVAFCSCGQTLFGPSALGLVAGLPLLAVGIVCWLRLSNKMGNPPMDTIAGMPADKEKS